MVAAFQNYLHAIYGLPGGFGISSTKRLTGKAKVSKKRDTLAMGFPVYRDFEEIKKKVVNQISFLKPTKSTKPRQDYTEYLLRIKELTDLARSIQEEIDGLADNLLLQEYQLLLSNVNKTKQDMQRKILLLLAFMDD